MRGVFVALLGLLAPAGCLLLGNAALSTLPAIGSRMPAAVMETGGQNPFEPVVALPVPALLLTFTGVATMIAAPLVTSTGSPPGGLALTFLALGLMKLGAESIGE
mmetsp:Transcript_27301/g.58805  ORF Transcript_27301/g.58805 Transcript_27301/m.58805 type:complete len:105 (-) Transcript_27301:498-812(-)